MMLDLCHEDPALPVHSCVPLDLTLPFLRLGLITCEMQNLDH